VIVLQTIMDFKWSICFEIQRYWLVKFLSKQFAEPVDAGCVWNEHDSSLFGCLYYYNYIIIVIYQLVACWTVKEVSSWYHFVIQCYLFCVSAQCCCERINAYCRSQRALQAKVCVVCRLKSAGQTFMVSNNGKVRTHSTKAIDWQSEYDKYNTSQSIKPKKYSRRKK
jgi:hypothetical protein